MIIETEARRADGSIVSPGDEITAANDGEKWIFQQAVSPRRNSSGRVIVSKPGVVPTSASIREFYPSVFALHLQATGEDARRAAARRAMRQLGDELQANAPAISAIMDAADVDTARAAKVGTEHVLLMIMVAQGLHTYGDEAGEYVRGQVELICGFAGLDTDDNRDVITRLITRDV